MNNALPAEVVATDHDLESALERDSEALARHRWHWTLDGSNPKRVSASEYAQRVGKHQSTVSAMVNGYARYVTAMPEAQAPLSEYISRAAMGAETEAAAEAVAKARGISIGSAARGTRTHETRRVREVARQLAEERGTSVAEEAPRVAETLVRAERAQQAEQAVRATHTDNRFFDMERYLISAKRELHRAVKLAPQVAWDDEHRELLSETIDNLKSLLGLLDSAISGVSGTDWDAEFAKIGEL